MPTKKSQTASTNLEFGLMVVNHPLEDAFEVASSARLRHLEIDVIQPHLSLESFPPGRIKRLLKLARLHEISLSLHTPYTINPADEVAYFRKANQKYLERLISLACRLRCTHITTHMGFWVGLASWKWKRKIALRALIKTLRNLLPSLRRHRIRLALENVNPMPEDSEFQLLGDNIGDFKRIYSELDSPLIRMCLDLGHAHTHEGPHAYLADFGPRISAVHFHDNHGKYDEHLAIGKGTIDWQMVAADFREIGFVGPFISEIFELSPRQAKNGLLAFFKNAEAGARRGR